jgi:hypothetical protein
MIFFAKTPEIDLRRFSFQISLGVTVAIHEKLEKFQKNSIEDQKTSNNSRNIFNVTKLIT